jgi:hypothetical protein
MRLSVARLCLDCEEVHESDTCPVCGSETFAFVKRWVPASSTAAKSNPPVLQQSPQGRSVEQLETYDQLLKPSPGRTRKRGFIAGGALGLAVLGATRLIWRSGKTKKQDG